MGICFMVCLKKMFLIILEEIVCNSGSSSNSLLKWNGCEG